MPREWTVDQVLALAPDASSAKSGKELSTGRKWGNLGRNDRAIWGECQGSGSKPYQTQIDSLEPAFKCSCPSRKFPCKHGLGLFLMFAERPDTIPAGKEPPGWVSQWLSTRDEKAEKKAAKNEEAAEKEVDPQAQAKRIAGREKKIAAGLEQLQTWLKDVISRGLASAQGEGVRPWDQMAARMVDAQAPGLARMIREIGESMNSGEGWQRRSLLKISRVYLLMEASKRIDALPPALREEVRSLIGWSQPTEEVAKQEGVSDCWMALGQRVGMQDSLRFQKTWLLGKNSGKMAMHLQFAHGTTPFGELLAPGGMFEGKLAFYAGLSGRAILKERSAAGEALTRMQGFASIDGALEAFARALSENPFIESFPMVLTNVTANGVGEGLVVQDERGFALPVVKSPGQKWRMLAVCGGKPADVFAEWDGESLSPLGMCAQGRYYALNREQPHV